jgi:hypothetical protein
MTDMKYYRVVLMTDRLRIQEFDVVKVTRSGVWVFDGYYRQAKRFILNGSSRSFAKPTKQEALESYAYRTYRRINLLNSSLKQCNEGIKIALACKDPEKILDYNDYHDYLD